MKFFGVVLLAVLATACIKPPDDGMALGDATPTATIDQVLTDAQGGVPESQAFHVGDTGVIESMETVYSSTTLKESEVYKLTSMDSDYFYFDDYKVKADTTTHYKMARAAHSTPSPTPTPTASATPASTTTSEALFAPVEKFLKLVGIIKAKINLIVAKITIQTSTALGESVQLQPTRKMDWVDLNIQRDVLNAVHAKDNSTIESTAQNPSNTEDDSGGTTQYFGLKHYKHSYLTSNCSQIKDCKVTSTHIEFNAVTTTSGQSTQVHWTYEISPEVPGLFVIMSRCGSAVTMVNNAQVPYMECWTLDTFHFGAVQNPTQE
jgi:hypothetical protein